MFKITLYIFPFILFNRSLYHNATLQTVPSAFLKSTKAQNNFFFLLFKISKNKNNVNILSVVEYDFLNPNWFSSNKKTSSENTRSLSFKIAVNSLLFLWYGSETRSKCVSFSVCIVHKTIYKASWKKKTYQVLKQFQKKLKKI